MHIEIGMVICHMQMIGTLSTSNAKFQLTPHELASQIRHTYIITHGISPFLATTMRWLTLGNHGYARHLQN